MADVDPNLGESGGVTFSDALFGRAAFGKTRYRIMLLLYFMGMVGAAVWFIVSYLAAVPSSDQTMATSDTSLIFTILMGYHVLLLLTSGFVTSWTVFAKRIVTDAGGTGRPSFVSSWSSLAVANKRTVQTAIVLLTLTLVGLLVSQVTFLASRSQGYNVHFSDYMFDVTGGVTQELVTSIGGECEAEITTRCLIGNFDNYLAQSFVNTNQLGIIFSIFLFYGYWSLFWSFYWAYGMKHKSPGAYVQTMKIIGAKDIKIVDSENGTTLIEKQDVAFESDFTLSMLSFTLWCTVLVFLSMWLVQIITVSGIYDGLCRILDKYFVWWCVNYTLLGAAFICFASFLLAYAMKNTVKDNTTHLQKYTYKILVINFGLAVILVGCTGLIWFINTGTITTLAIPTPILCREDGYFRQYNANKVLESFWFFYCVFLLIDYWFLHSQRIRRIKVYSKPVSRSEK